MYLEDVIDLECGIKQDEWSTTAPPFGKEGQLKVIGWSGRENRAKCYILMCSVCSQDVDMYGEGYFRSKKSQILEGKLPCGCSSRPTRSKGQYAVLCTRKALEMGLVFLGFAGEWLGSKTKILMSCPTHGDWSTGTINNLISKGHGCPGCRIDFVRAATTKPNSVMINSFLVSGSYHPDTVFWRSDRLNSINRPVYWNMYCPDCGATAVSFVGDLHQGQRPCLCSKQRQTIGYINLIKDGDLVVAVKFGISNNPRRRIKQQVASCVYEMQQYSLWEFPDKVSCYNAERECLKALECGVLPKSDMPDGWSETTHPHNIDSVIEIYERNGGLRQIIDHSLTQDDCLQAVHMAEGLYDPIPIRVLYKHYADKYAAEVVEGYPQVVDSEIKCIVDV